MENASFEEKAYPWGLPVPFTAAPVRETMANVAPECLPKGSKETEALILHYTEGTIKK